MEKLRTFKLLYIEILKNRGRFEIWLFLVLYFCALLFTTIYALPEPSEGPLRLSAARNVWDAALEIGRNLGAVAALLVAAFVVSVEEAWRTHRQNILHGLTRTEYYSAKAIACALLITLLWVGSILLPATVSAFALRTLTPALIIPVHPALLLGLLLYLFLAGSIAFLFTFLVRGVLVALVLAGILMYGQRPVAVRLAEQGPAGAVAGSFLPGRVMASLMTSFAYDRVRLADVNQRLAGLRANAPELSTRMLPILPGWMATLASVGYVLVFAGGGWLHFRRRDLL